MNDELKHLYKSWDNENHNSQILIVNCGSSSIKITLFSCNLGILNRLLDADFKKINESQPTLTISSFIGKIITALSAPIDISTGLQKIFNILTNQFNVSIPSLAGIGHRFVHGGQLYQSSVRADPTVIAALDQLLDLAPLHNAACLAGIKTCTDLRPNIPQVIVFDTAFHHTIPVVAAQYALPHELARRYHIKRYGFHGISHAFLWNTYKGHVGEESAQSKVITLHLGNGCSAAAISGGISIDTSMGFTPAEGLIMATRAGDVDAAIMECICMKEDKTPTEVMDILNFKSGLQGVSGLSSDMEILLDRSKEHAKAKLAVDMFCYRVVKYIGAYIAILGGVDALVFSGGIGEHSPRSVNGSFVTWSGMEYEWIVLPIRKQ